jgi:NAD(P)-dependent dehydrogenase (short-subunit alcohol dehydrogenase family)
MFDKLLPGKNALITGAGGTIGRSIAIEMAKQGANIFFTEIDKGKCNSLEKELQKYQVISQGLLSDITSNQDINHLLASLLKEQVAIDILVNNVGIDMDTSIKKLDLDVWKRVYHTNIFGPLDLTQHISKMMVDHQIEGSVIFITSIHQWIVRRGAGYSSSKAALGMIIKELALELAPYKIRVNGIAPGYVREDKDGKPLPHQYTPLHNTSINSCFIGRAAVYLASDFFSKMTTGTVIKIDAGLSLYNHLLHQIPLK